MTNPRQSTPDGRRPRRLRTRTAILATLLLAAGIAALLLMTVDSATGSGDSTSPAHASVRRETLTFDYVGAAVTVRIPDWAHFAELEAIGGKGGGSFQFSGREGTYWTGGDGARITGGLDLEPSTFLTVRVGGFGGDSDLEAHPGAGGWGATGNGGRGGTSSSGDAGGGGGSTSVTLGSSRVLVAGGGGGAGGRGLAVPSQEPGPGGSSGTSVDPGHDGKGVGAGSGGHGGSGGAPGGGGGGNGSHLGGGGGGGGSGVHGGAGGSGGGFGAGGGGGGGAGSSEISPLLLDHSINRGVTSDGDGRVTVTWYAERPTTSSHAK